MPSATYLACLYLLIPIRFIHILGKWFLIIEKIDGETMSSVKKKRRKKIALHKRKKRSRRDRHKNK
jgi:hypothetical protein